MEPRMKSLPFVRWIPKSLLALVVMVTLSANAQDTEPSEQPAEPPVELEPVEDIPSTVQASLGVLLGFPVGRFGNNITNPGIGIGGHIGYRIPNSPLIVGLDLGYLIYGRESRRERFSLTIPDVTVDVITSNSILDANFLLRLQPRTGILRPYIDGLIGFHYLFTKTSIKNIPSNFSDDIASSTNFDDFAFAYGGGAGVMIHVYDGRKNRTKYNKGIRTVSIDLRLRYMDGARADYLKRGAVTRNSGNVSLNVTSSETNLVTAFIGAAVEF